MKTKLKSSIIAYHMAVGHRVAAAMVCALCAVGLSAFAADPSVTINEVKSLQPWDKAKGTITVDYSLGGLDAATDYKVAFDITANGVTKGVTNAAAKLTSGKQAVFTNDTVSLFSAETRAEDAKVKVSLIAIKPKLGGVQLWKDGPFWAEANLGDAEQGVPAEYGALYTFDNATNEVAKLGDGWRLPTNDELEALCSNCTGAWDGTKKGYTFTGNGDYSSKSIFLPAAGYGSVSGRESAGDEGDYWSSKARDSGNAQYLLFYDGYAEVNSSDRSLGMSVRAVRDAK